MRLTAVDTDPKTGKFVVTSEINLRESRHLPGPPLWQVRR